MPCSVLFSHLTIITLVAFQARKLRLGEVTGFACGE